MDNFPGLAEFVAAQPEAPPELVAWAERRLGRRAKPAARDGPGAEQ